MNVFVIHPDFARSCRELAEASPIHAKKQLVECCQILASAERNTCGDTSMFKADGSKYKHAHPHHPITKLVGTSYAMWNLTYTVGMTLAAIYDNHEAGYSIRNWKPLSPPTTGGDLIVCRLGREPVITQSLAVYSIFMRTYLRTHKGIKV
jgi:hypothetical protein